MERPSITAPFIQGGFFCHDHRAGEHSVNALSYLEIELKDQEMTIG